jgi:hypothetical protein
MLASAVLFSQGSWLEPYRTVTPRIVGEAATAGSAAWTRLAELTDTFPGRLSGSFLTAIGMSFMPAQACPGMTKA